MNSSSPTKRSLLKRHRAALLVGALALGGTVVAGQDALFSASQAFAQAANENTSAQPIVTMPSFRPIVEKVSPAVVAVQVKTKAGPVMSGGPDVPGLPDGHPLERFFRDFGGPGERFDRGPRSERRHRFSRGLGSGFFISEDGYLVTNNHVIDKAEEVNVVLEGGETYEARIIGHDDKTDLALLKVDADRKFPFVNWGDAETHVGDWVVAVGNPFGLGGTVTAGIVSARGREIGSGPYDDYIQIDAPINRGNSGGPTFDLSGNVVGVNTAIFSPSGGSVGIGFAIPATIARAVVEDLKDDGKIVRGWLGVQIQPITADIADSLGLASDKGALVTEPQADSPASAAGIKAGDAILAVDGKQVQSPRDLARLIAGMDPDSEVTVTVWRDGEKQDIEVELGRLPGSDQRASLDTTPGDADDMSERLGLALAPADALGSGEGVAVVEVDPDSQAAGKGLQTGDVILSVGGEPVSTPADVKRGVDKARSSGRKAVLFQVRTQQGVRFVALPVDRA